MGKFNASSNNIYQDLTGVLGGGVFGMPAYFNGTLYYGAVGDAIKAFKITNAKLSTSPSFQTSNTFGYPGTTPSISANGTSNAIVWAAENNPAARSCTPTTPAIFTNSTTATRPAAAATSSEPATSSSRPRS